MTIECRQDREEKVETDICRVCGRPIGLDTHERWYHNRWESILEGLFRMANSSYPEIHTIEPKAQ